MQGLPEFVPTDQKAAYLNALLQVGFHTLDAGSFVSPKAIPQMRDTARVLESLQFNGSDTRLLAIVANARGATQAADFPEISYMGFPLSVSETFQQRNTNRSVEEALDTVAEIQEICEEAGKMLVVYLSMAFGNPYQEPYDPAALAGFVEKLDALEAGTISLADTVGSTTPGLVAEVFGHLLARFPHIEFGAHFHSVPQQAAAILNAAWQAGCRRFDGAIGGMGGCPMAQNNLTGNMPTEAILQMAEKHKARHGLNLQAFAVAQQLKQEIFGQ